MVSYKKIEHSGAETVFENPFENQTSQAQEASTTHSRADDGSSSRLISSFEISDDERSEDEENIEDADPVSSNNSHIEESRTGPSNARHRQLDSSYFEEPELSVAAAATNGIGPRRRLTARERIVATIDRVTSNTPGRKLLHALFPAYVTSTSTSNPYRGQVVGNGMQNDGVFSNMTAKPSVNDDAHGDVPPSYDEAAADAAPLYWESTVFSQYGDEVFVDGLPVGNIVNFVWNLMVSSAFQFVGFILTYLLHTSHAAKEGSRAGLGVTFMSYGYYMIPEGHFFGLSFKILGSQTQGLDQNPKFEPSNPNDIDVDSNYILEGSVDNFHSSLDSSANGGDQKEASGQYFDENSAPIFAYGLVALGVFILIKSLLDYHRAKQMEKVILQSPTAAFDVESPDLEEA